MAIAFGTKTHGTTGSTAGPVTVTEPASGADGDIYLLFFLNTAGVTKTTPTGWTLLNNWAGTNSNVSLYWIRRSGAPSLSVSLSGTAGFTEWSVLRYTGCIASGSPVGASTYSAARQGANAINCPSVTTTGSNSMVLAFGSKWGGSTGAVWGAATGYTIREDGVSVTNDICAMEKAIAAPGAEDPGAFTNNSTSTDTITEGTIELLSPVATDTLFGQACL